MTSCDFFVALDLDDPNQAFKLAQQVAGNVSGFKIGPRLLFRGGAEFVKSLLPQGQVFLDFKFFDIPSTMEGSVRAAFDLGVSTVTIHALAGPECLQRLALVEKELNSIRPFRLLAVTVLTSFSQSTLPSPLAPAPISELVLGLAQDAISCGISGLVCSPLEVQALRGKFPQAYLLTPGIRRDGDSHGDQKRTLTPAEACQKGASGIVVGRPILESKNPLAVAQEISQALRSTGAR